MRFRKLTIGRLPRVFVNILALDDSDRQSIWDEIRSTLPNDLLADRLAVTLAGILKRSKADRRNIANKFNVMLDDLLAQDFFGTEGQCDPRGDHRD